MKINEFNELLNEEIENIKLVLNSKQKEYVLNPDKDRLEHFKRTAQFLNTNTRTALLSMLSKHLISISDMCNANELQPLEKWYEKITDSINYLILLLAIVEEENDEKNRSENIKS